LFCVGLFRNFKRVKIYRNRCWASYGKRKILLRSDGFEKGK